MSIKQFYGDMDKKERQIFSEIEKMIIQTKIECLQAIPKNLVYDDSEIRKSIISLTQKIDNFSIKLAFFEGYYSQNISQDDIQIKFSKEMEKAERILLEMKAFQAIAVQIITNIINSKTPITHNSFKMDFTELNIDELKEYENGKPICSSGVQPIIRDLKSKKLGLPYEDNLKRFKSLEKERAKK